MPLQVHVPWLLDDRRPRWHESRKRNLTKSTGEPTSIAIIE